MENEKFNTDNERRPKVYEELNVFGKYQVRLCFLMLLSTIPNAFTTFQFLAIHYTPPFRCVALNGTSHFLTKMDNGTNLTDSRLINTCTFDNLTGLTPTNSSKPHDMTDQDSNGKSQLACTDWIFMEKEVSAVTEFGMICNNSWQIPFSTSMFMFGKLVGGLIGGFISDRFGRKTTFLAFSAWQYSSTFVTSFTQNATSYAAMMFLSGCGGLVNFVAAVLLSTEVVAPNRRSLCYVYTSAGYSIGCMLIAPLAFFISDWRWYLRLTSLVGLLYIPYIWLLDESPRWLLAVGRIKAAKKILKKIAKCNKMQSSVPEDDSSDLLVESDDSIGLWGNCKLIARTPTLLKRLAIIGLSWLTCSGTYYTISLDIGKLGGNRYLNILFLGLAELVATGLFFIASQRWGRRDSYMAFMAGSAVVIAAGPLFKLTNVAALQVAAVMAGRLMTAVSFAIIYVYTGELSPTTVRNLVMGYSSGCSRIGSMLAPFVIYAGHQTSSVAVPIGMAVFIFFTTILYIFLPKTKKAQLPQTVREAVEMKSNLRFSCRSKDPKTKTPKKNTDITANL